VRYYTKRRFSIITYSGVGFEGKIAFGFRQIRFLQNNRVPPVIRGRALPVCSGSLSLAGDGREKLLQNLLNLIQLSGEEMVRALDPPGAEVDVIWPLPQLVIWPRGWRIHRCICMRPKPRIATSRGQCSQQPRRAGGMGWGIADGRFEIQERGSHSQWFADCGPFLPQAPTPVATATRGVFAIPSFSPGEKVAEVRRRMRGYFVACLETRDGTPHPSVP
jgi:hypothetical protein